MVHHVLAMLTALVLIPRGDGQVNLLKNPGFEGDLRGTWTGNGFLLQRYNGDKVEGSYSANCSQRDTDIEGPLQFVTLKTGGRYEFSGYVKILNDIPATLWQSVKTVIQFQHPNQTDLASYIVAYRGFLQASNGWIKINGSIDAPMKEFLTARLSIRGPDPGVNFLVDDLKLYEIPEDTNWRSTAFTNIENYRKSNVSFLVTLPSGLEPSDVDLQISLKKHLFPFGAKVEDSLISQEPTTDYAKLFYNFFNWGMVNSYKWKMDAGTQGAPDFSRAINSTNKLIANGLKVRGHNLFWDYEKNNPNWVLALSNSQLYTEMDNRIQYMCNITYNKLTQFAVMNEHIQGHYYEERLQDPNVTMDSFRKSKVACDPNIKLYLNDFTAVTSGANTEEYYALAMYYLSQGVPLEGLGAEGHTKDNVKPDPTMMWRRIDRLAQTGLELFMTEFDIPWPDVVERADWLEDAYRAFFGHPKLSGVLMWDFWDVLSSEPNKELFTGPNMTIIETGQRWGCLVKKEWNTNVVKNLGSSGLNFDIRGFQGDYQVVVRKSGVPVQVETFTLGKTSTTVNIQVTTSLNPVAIYQETDYVPECVSHRGQKSLGNKTSNSNTSSLTCRTVTSLVSGPNENDEASVTCLNEEVLTGCSSYHVLNQWTRNGEKIVFANGQAICKAYNGRSSPNGVQAVARCCALSGLVCNYRTAGPSSPMDSAKAEATCPNQYKPLGCSAYNPYPDFDGVYPDLVKNSCLAQSGNPILPNPAERSGSTAFSACCSATNLVCQQIHSDVTSLVAGAQASVSCPVGYIMTGCNAFASDGKSGGARINNSSGTDLCIAFLGADLPAGTTGVVAIAMCCTILS